MIDIIIPAYNSQDTIKKTLASIAQQLNIDEIETTIVNDGGNDYKQIVEDFSPIMKVKEIGYEENRGPGYARQYGIDHTTHEYITFIDADDTFMTSLSLRELVNPLKMTEANFVISPFIQVGKEVGQMGPVQPNLVWVFGKMYRRAFLDKYQIRFSPTRANEDVGFNKQCQLIGGEKASITPNPTYLWQYNEISITRRENNEYEFGICTPGFIYNNQYAYDKAQKEGVPMEKMAEGVLEALFSCFMYYNVALSKEIPEDAVKAIETLSRRFYKDYYNKVMPYISKEKYKQIYTQSMQSKGNHLDSVIFKMTLDDFIDLMLNQEDTNPKTYEEIEAEIQGERNTHRKDAK